MSDQNLNRREFLKLLMLAPFAANRAGRGYDQIPQRLPSHYADKPNILIFLFDTLSARNMSLYGYPRQTTPNLERFAEKATVYHQHHAGGNWTPTGTSSLLTGTYPWTHRNFSLYCKTLDSIADRNIFSALTNDYHTLAHTQNPLVQSALHQYRSYIDKLTYLDDDGLISFRPEGDLFNEDYSRSSWGQNITQSTWATPASSPFFSILIDLIYTLRYRKMAKTLKEEYPYWISTVTPGIYIFLDQTIDWLTEELPNIPTPTLSYFHLFPPHAPYAPRQEFCELFDDSWRPPEKPVHVFNDGSRTEFLVKQRKHYDQFIANIDHDFGLVLEALEHSGLMETSYIIFTSDHGESIERGIWGHDNQLLYEPLIHIPLLIHKPGQTGREDVFTPTSAVDLLPTLCEISQQSIPDWVEGEILPGFRQGVLDPQRPVFSVEAKKNSKFAPLTTATLAMIKWPYKLIHYLGYEELPDSFELYNLAEDPEELEDLYQSAAEIAEDLQSQLLEKLEEVNQNIVRKDLQ